VYQDVVQLMAVVNVAMNSHVVWKRLIISVASCKVTMKVITG
jgi:hypothetical protein